MQGFTAILLFGLEYVDAIFQTIKNSDFSEYTMIGIKSLAVVFFLVNILTKYVEDIDSKTGYTWGLSPGDLAKNLLIVLLVIFSDQILSMFDAVLVSIETSYRDTAPALLPLQLQDLSMEESPSAMQAAQKGLSLLYEALVNPLFGWKILAFILSLVLWILDLFIYPLFLAERYFLLGLMQAFFPLILSLATFEKFRSMAYSFFKLYAGVYMIVPAFFLVNVFVNALYTEMTNNFWQTLFGTDFGSETFAPVVQLGTVGFIVFLKFKLYRKAISFTLKLFNG